LTYIRVENLTIQYSEYSPGYSLKRKLINSLRGINSEPETRNTRGCAPITNLSFALKEGDRLILLGKNGAGKTTLLKALSGIYEPSEGLIEMKGTRSSLIDIGAGLDFGLTGEENTRLHYLMRKNVFSDISCEQYVLAVKNFSGLLEDFYKPVSSYSSGMFVRLTFAMVTEVAPEILLLDEWLSAGDSRFMANADSRMNHLATQAKILVLATHSEELALKWGTKAILLGSEKLYHFENIKEAFEFYRNDH